MSDTILHHLAMPGESAAYRAARNKLLAEEKIGVTPRIISSATPTNGK